MLYHPPLHLIDSAMSSLILFYDLLCYPSCLLVIILYFVFVRSPVILLVLKKLKVPYSFIFVVIFLFQQVSFIILIRFIISTDIVFMRLSCFCSWSCDNALQVVLFKFLLFCYAILLLTGLFIFYHYKGYFVSL